MNPAFVMQLIFSCVALLYGWIDVGAKECCYAISIQLM